MVAAAACLSPRVTRWRCHFCLDRVPCVSLPFCGRFVIVVVVVVVVEVVVGLNVLVSVLYFWLRVGIARLLRFVQACRTCATIKPGTWFRTVGGSRFPAPASRVAGGWTRICTAICRLSKKALVRAFRGLIVPQVRHVRHYDRAHSMPPPSSSQHAQRGSDSLVVEHGSCDALRLVRLG